MGIEYEAAFLDINKDEMRKRLSAAGAILERPEFDQRRVVLSIPGQKDARHVWARVRDEGNKVTMAWKAKDGDAIEGQKEIQLTVDDFGQAVKFLEQLGCIQESYQETKRELWHLDQVEVVIDTWPFLDPLVEIEGTSEQAVRVAAETLGFDWSDAHFDSAGRFYRMKYGEHADPTKVPRLTFEIPNPFV